MGRAVSTRRFRGWLIGLLTASALTACAGANDLDNRAVYLGDFKLGHSVVVSPQLVKGPVSREASKEEWIEAVDRAVDARFGRYQGPRFVNLGISVDGYVLAVPGVPVVAAPRSALIIRVTAWNDAESKKFNDQPKVITVVEDISAETTVSSGLTQTKEEQIDNLAVNAAKLIEKWLVEQNEEFGWFETDGVPAKDKNTPRFQPDAVPLVVQPPQESDTASTPVPAPASDPAPASEDPVPTT